MSSERLHLNELPDWIERQHVARYQFASRFVAGRNVLDLACGSSYGSQMLADAGAERVLGVDQSQEAILRAQQEFQRPNLTFEVGDAQNLPNIPDGCFDAVVSFETVEHLPDDVAFIKEVHRVLRVGGSFILSTPDLRPGCIRPRLTKKPANPFHVREYTRSSLLRLLSGRFQIIEMAGQNFVSGCLCLLPVAAIIKTTCAGLGRFGGHDIAQSLYYGGTGPTVRPEPAAGWLIPNYWVVRSVKA